MKLEVLCVDRTRYGVGSESCEGNVTKIENYLNEVSSDVYK
jgi:hypothetical protein